MERELEIKYNNLRDLIKGYGSALIAFSGGVDSTLLAKISFDELKERSIAVTALSQTYPEFERNEALKLAEMIGINHKFINSEELEIEGFAQNTKDRCYYCKRELFSKLQEMAKLNNLNCVLDGSNYDDRNDYRPGFKAVKELNIKSPLFDTKITKPEIRILSKELGLPNWDKPSFACLSSRFPYGTEITKENLSKISNIEEFLRINGFKQFRARFHNNILRIEILPDEFSRMLDDNFRLRLIKLTKENSFNYVTLDLVGYRTGSMNEVI